MMAMPHPQLQVYGIRTSNYGWLGAHEGNCNKLAFLRKEDADKFIAKHGKGSTTFGGSWRSEVIPLDVYSSIYEYEEVQKDKDILMDHLNPKAKRKFTDEERQKVRDKYED